MGSPTKSKKWLAGGLVLVAAIIAAAVTFESWRESVVRRMTSNRNLTAISVALHCYQSYNRSLPPAYTTDKDGRPMHSWRTLLLTELDKDLYNKIDFGLPWNDAKNLRHAASVPYCYQYQETKATPKGTTDYVVLLDRDGLWPRGKAGTTAGRSDDILVFEVENSSIQWMEPRDLTLAEVLNSIHPQKGAPATRLRILAYVTVGDEIHRLDHESDYESLYESLKTGHARF
jgi:hypothetical protein